jgi:hypothetical protein
VIFSSQIEEVNIGQLFLDASATLAIDWRAIDPRLPDVPACNLQKSRQHFEGAS